jgi:hypothetical protein
MKKKFTSHLLKLPLIVLYAIPFIVSAQSNQSFQLTNPLNGYNDLPSLIAAILNNIIEPLAAVAVVVMIIYSGFKYLTAQGNPGEIKKANEGLLWVLVGAGILLSAAAISAAVQGTFSQLLAK